MALSFNDYLSLVESGYYRQKIKIEVLRLEDLTVVNEIQSDLAQNGSINIQRKNGQRRTASFTLINSTITLNGKYVPNIDNEILPPRQPFKIYLGLADSLGEVYWIPQGVFVLQDPTLNSIFSESTVDINVCDLFGMYDGTVGGELVNTHIVPLGSNIFDVLKSLLAMNGYYISPLFQTSLLTEITPYTITKEAGATIGDIIIELSYLLSCNVFFNTEGQLEFYRDVDDNIKPSIYDFTTDKVQYMGANQTFNYSKLYNACLVIGSNINGTTYSYEAVNTNLQSSTSVNNLGFKRTYRHEDENIDSVAKCQLLAEFLLKRLISVQSEISITSIPIHYFDVDNIVTLTDINNLNLDMKRLLITSLTIPLKIGDVMSIGCVDAVDLPYSDIDV